MNATEVSFTEDWVDVSAEQPQQPASTLFGGPFDDYSRHAYQRGRYQAITEAIASILPAVDAFVRRDPSVSAEGRELLYRFERFLARRLDADERGLESARPQGFSDGEGI